MNALPLLLAAGPDPQTTAILATLGVVALLLLYIFIKSNMVICAPNELVILSGATRKKADGSKIGYRVLRGGRGFRWPIIETAYRISLSNIPIEIELTGALTKGIIPINVAGRGNVKIASTEDQGLDAAIERFLGKRLDEVGRVAKETLDGCLRGVVATRTPDKANEERKSMESEIVEQAREDLKQLGLVLDFFKVQHISDDEGYLDAIARRENAAVRRDAKIAEATADAEARSVAAEQQQKGRIAETTAEKEVIANEQALAVHRANLEAETNRAKKAADIAAGIKEVEEEAVLERAKIERNKAREEAKTIIPAEAAKRAAEMAAQGAAAQIHEEGKATAEAIRMMKEQWESGEARELFLIRMLPDLVDKVTSTIADNLRIDKLTVLDGGDGSGLPNHVKNVTGSAVTILEQMKNATGLDIAEILKTRGGGDTSGSANLPKELNN